MYDNCTKNHRVCDQYYLEEEGGKRCVAANSSNQLTCLLDNDCGQMIKDTPYCSGNNVLQLVNWQECQNPGTSQSKCIDKTQTNTVETCDSSQVCQEGGCKSKQVTTTTIKTTTTTIKPPTTTTTTTSSTTTTITTTTSTSTLPNPSIIENVVFKSPIELILVVFRTVLDVIIFWD